MERVARLVQPGTRQARHFGQAKTKWQLLLAAAVANLVLVAVWELTTGTSPGPGNPSFSLLLQLTLVLLLGPNLIGEVKRRQHPSSSHQFGAACSRPPVSGRISRVGIGR